ncbi:hypothetical protein AUP68_11029, partial [Ilyonectria robusta]
MATDSSDDVPQGDIPDNPPTSTPRACDACRLRKIRCGRNFPCSQCVQTKIPCVYTDRRPKEKSTRILLSANYERKIDTLDRRLEQVTLLLQEIKTNLPSTISGSLPPTQSKEASPEGTTIYRPSVPSIPIVLNDTVQATLHSFIVEGESSLAANAVFAHEFLQNFLHTNILEGASLEMNQSLEALQHIVDGFKQKTAATEMHYSKARHIQRPTLPDIKLPPIEKTVSLIRRCKSPTAELSEMSTWIFEITPLKDFPETCLRIYVSEDCSDADILTANYGMFHFYLQQSQTTSSSAEREETASYAEMCRENLETTLSNLSLHLPATSSMISALLLGAYYSVEISKPWLAWTLTCKASELCQRLGYNRLSSMTSDTTEDQEYKQLLFWRIYHLDKSLSLRLGRSSSVQDEDVTVPIPPVEGLGTRPLSAFVSMWIRTARCQGNIYQMLYSPDSIKMPNCVRRHRVSALVKDLEEIRLWQVSIQWIEQAYSAIGEGMVKFISASDDVLRLSLLTLVYRASPPSEGSHTIFIPECIEAARATLRRHRDCMSFVESAHSRYFPPYLHMTLLSVPFVPFIILFCHVIESHDMSDVASLHDFLASIEPAPKVSEAAAEMYRLLQVLYSVALRYIEFHTSD